MKSIGNKRTKASESIKDIQSSNQQWWTDYTMSYDWNDGINLEKFSHAWFEEIDQRFIYGARLFAHDKEPFDKIIPLNDLQGKKVLEIGCGMGFHTELLVRAGAEVTTIDISETSINATKKRLELKNLSANIHQMDAVDLSFPSESFDFVWSWGVIHHSAQTAKIISQISRVLVPSGEVRLMVYNLNGASAYLALVPWFLSGFWRGKMMDEFLWSKTDGFMARYYTPDILSDFMGVFFSKVNFQTFGQDVDAILLPSALRKIFLKLYSPNKVSQIANKRGGFLFMTATK